MAGLPTDAVTAWDSFIALDFPLRAGCASQTVPRGSSRHSENDRGAWRERQRQREIRRDLERV